MKRMFVVLLSVILLMTLSQAAFAVESKEMAAEELERYNIVHRNHLGELSVDGPVTRAELTKMLVSMLASEAFHAAPDFIDVPADHDAVGYIAQAVRLGIVNGMGDGTFAPDSYVTYQQAMKMLVCTLGYGARAERQGGYPHGYVMTGVNLGIAPKQASMTENADRGDIVMMLAAALDVPLIVTDTTADSTNYKILNGENGEELVTLRIKLED